MEYQESFNLFEGDGSADRFGKSYDIGADDMGTALNDFIDAATFDKDVFVISINIMNMIGMNGKRFGDEKIIFLGPMGFIMSFIAAEGVVLLKIRG